VVDQDQLFQNFGFPIQVQQENSQEYKNVLQGLWYAYWNGPSIGNMVRGLNLVFDLPFAPKSGVITEVSLPDTAFIIGSVQSTTGDASGTFDVSTANNSRFLSFSVDNLPPILVIFPDDTAYPALSVVADINAAAGQTIASVTTDGRIRLSGLTTVQINTVLGNPGLGFEPGQEDFGTYNVTILGDDGVSDTFSFGSQFPADVVVGQRVERFDPFTTGVGIFDEILLPEWWSVFNIAQINPSIETFSQEDRDIVNNLLANFTFAVRVVADAFLRLGSVDRSIVRFFLEQIKPTISDYLFIVAQRFFEIISVTDNQALLGLGSPSASYAAQRGLGTSEVDTLALDIGITTARDLEWNFANHWLRNNPVHPTLGDRATFEANYHLPQYDDLRLTTEDATVVAPGTITVVAGVGPVSYVAAELTGTVSAQFFDTSVNSTLTLNINGILQPVINYTVGTAVSASTIIQETNSQLGADIMSRAPSGELLLRSELVPGTPSILVISGNPSLGFATLASDTGVASSSLLETVPFS
jgi:hypothetical protein